MDQTPNLQLPYILAAQAQKHVTHNEAIRALDALVQLAVLDRDLAAPPVTPIDGARYIVAAGATGPWAGQALKIAAFQDLAWTFFTALEGWIAWIADEDIAVAWNGSAWIALASGGGGSASVNPTPLVGVNATADTTNRLSVVSPASLFNHEGSGHQLKINKAAAANTASLLYQDAFSGRAEIGLTGDDDLHVKVSADGTTWREAIVVARATGVVSMPNTPAAGGGGSINPNLLLNGDFQINQRQFAGGALVAGVYGFDRWKADTGGANCTLSGYVATLTSGTLVQAIEGAMWGYANLASTQITVSLDAPSADIAVTVGSATGTITAGSGRRSATLTTAAGDSGHLSVKLSRTTVGSVTFGRVKVELGATATAWQARARDDELRLCQRYCTTTYPPGVAPGSTNTATGAIIAHVQCIVANAGWTSGLRFPVPLRSTPTFSFWSRQGSSGNATSFNSGSQFALSVNSLTAHGIWWFGGSGMTVGDFMDIAYLATAEI